MPLGSITQTLVIDQPSNVYGGLTLIAKTGEPVQPNMQKEEVVDATLVKAQIQEWKTQSVEMIDQVAQQIFATNLNAVDLHDFTPLFQELKSEVEQLNTAVSRLSKISNLTWIHLNATRMGLVKKVDAIYSVVENCSAVSNDPKQDALFDGVREVERVILDKEAPLYAGYKPNYAIPDLTGITDPEAFTAALQWFSSTVKKNPVTCRIVVDSGSYPLVNKLQTDLATAGITVGLATDGVVNAPQSTIANNINSANFVLVIGTVGFANTNSSDGNVRLQQTLVLNRAGRQPARVIRLLLQATLERAFPPTLSTSVTGYADFRTNDQYYHSCLRVLQALYWPSIDGDSEKMEAFRGYLQAVKEKKSLNPVS